MTVASVPLRQLGKNGPKIPAVGLGLMGLSMHYGPAPSDEERFKLLDRAVELGATNWDSSDMYGDSEEMLGKWFEATGNRSKIFLATKFGFVKGSISDINSSAAYARQACEESLRLLQTDYIDLYYMHRANANNPIEDTMRGLMELQKEGKIRYIGLSEVSSATLRRACKIGHVDAVQIEYAPSELAIEGSEGTDLLATCRELGVAIFAYSPLGRGLLGGVVVKNTDISAEGDWRGLFPRFSDKNFHTNVQVVRKLGELAQRKGVTTAQLCIAWVLKQGPDVIPIPGTKKIKYLEENFAAIHVQLSDTDEAEIRQIVKGIAGRRLPSDFEYQSFIDTAEEI